MLAATAVAAALRFHDLGAWSLWIDEAHTFRDATMPLAGENGFLRQDRVLYPLTFLALRGLLALGWIGTDEYSLRLPFALVGIATVPLMALAGRRLVGTGAAVLAAWLLALNPWHVFWSQNARGYVLVCCLAALACNRAHAYATTHRTRDAVATGLAIAVAALSHPTGGMLGVGLLAFVRLRSVERLHRRFVVWFVVVATLVAVGLPLAVERWAPFQAFLRAKSDASPLHFLQTTAFYFRPLPLLAAAIALGVAWRWLGRERALLLGCLGLAPFVSLLVIGVELVKVTARYAICTLPVLTWLVALACTRLGALALGPVPRRRRRPWAAALPLPLLLGADSAHHLVEYYTTQYGQRARWRPACEWVQEWAGDNGVRVLTVNQPTVTYYLRPDHWRAGGDPDPGTVVYALVEWEIDGKDDRGRTRHRPGAVEHLRWHEAEAAKAGARFAVVVMLPELAEIERRIDPEVDAGPAPLQRALAADYELALHLPCWVGPKDESIYVFVPKAR